MNDLKQLAFRYIVISPLHFFYEQEKFKYIISTENVFVYSVNKITGKG